MTILLLPAKLFLRLISIPFIILISLVIVIAKLLLYAGAYVISPCMLLILCGVIYTVFKRTWLHTGILTASECAIILLYFGYATIVFAMENLRDGMVRLVWR